MKVYITKYALTLGIREEEHAELFSGDMVRITGGVFDKYYHGNDWHIDIDKAIARAEEMRKKRIESLEKSLRKMKKIKF